MDRSGTFKPPGAGDLLFYQQAEALNALRHGDLRLAPGDAAFAGQAAAVPLTLSEFAAAAASYPILFGQADDFPVVLLGLEQTNLFVEEGRWSQGSYIPAYVRRYPFVLIEVPDTASFALGIDAASPRFTTAKAEGLALFEAGEPSEITKQALEFCGGFTQDHQRTRVFCAALADAGLLVERRADAALPDGRKLAVRGFQVIDVEAFLALDEARVVAWHRNGWLGLIHHHLLSLGRFSDLLARQGAREALGERAAAHAPVRPAAANGEG